MKYDYKHAILIVENKDKGLSTFLLEMLSYFYAPLDVIFVGSEDEELETSDPKYRYNEEAFYSLMDEINEMYHPSKKEREEYEVVLSYDLTPEQRISFNNSLNYTFIEYSDLLLFYFSNINRKSTIHRLLTEKMYYEIRRNQLPLLKVSAKEISNERHSITASEKALDKELAPLVSKREERINRIFNSATPLVALFGYPGSGKSTLYAALVSKLKGEIVEREPFTTDNKIKPIKNYRYPDFYLMNGIGYLETKPNLVDKYFSMYYEEFGYADLVVDIVDVTSHDYLEHIETCEEFIRSVSKHKDIKIIHLLNKTDEEEAELKRLPRSNELLVSLIEEEDIDEVVNFILGSLYEGWEKKTFLLPYEVPLETCYKQNYVTEVVIKETGHEVTCYLNPKYIDKYKNYST